MYVHVDAKVGGVPFGDLAASCSRSLVGFVGRMEVSWGDSSQVDCNLRLIGSALRRGRRRISKVAGPYAFWSVIYLVAFPRLSWVSVFLTFAVGVVSAQMYNLLALFIAL